MAQWANTLDITDAWAKAYDREIAPPEFCRLVANKLKDMAFKAKYAYMRDRRDELADAFMDFYEEYKDDPEAADYDDVDYLLTDLYDWGDRRTSNALFVGGRAFTAWSNAVGVNEFGNTVYGPRLVREEVECPDWLHGLSYNLCQPVFLVVSMQPGRIYGRTGKVEVLNMPPNLADMGLPRLLDAFSAYSGIQTWMENIRAVGDALNGIPEADNKIKIQAAGFDLKTSFRKR